MRVNGTVKLNELTDDQVQSDIARMDAIVRRAMMRRFSKTSDMAMDGRTPVTHADPFEELAAKEEAAIRDAALEATVTAQRVFDLVELPQAVVDRIRAAVFDQFRQYEEMLLEMIYDAGPHPLEVMRRFFAYTKMKKASLLCDMGFREIGPLLRETHAAAAIRCRALFGDYAPAAWKKGADAVEAMRRAQKGNRNRLGGVANGNGKHLNGGHLVQQTKNRKSNNENTIRV